MKKFIFALMVFVGMSAFAGDYVAMDVANNRGTSQQNYRLNKDLGASGLTLDVLVKNVEVKSTGTRSGGIETGLITAFGKSGFYGGGGVGHEFAPAGSEEYNFGYVKGGYTHSFGKAMFISEAKYRSGLDGDRPTRKNLLLGVGYPVAKNVMVTAAKIRQYSNVARENDQGYSVGLALAF